MCRGYLIRACTCRVGDQCSEYYQCTANQKGSCRTTDCEGAPCGYRAYDSCQTRNALSKTERFASRLGRTRK
jgi:hypothetical protein